MIVIDHFKSFTGVAPVMSAKWMLPWIQIIATIETNESNYGDTIATNVDRQSICMLKI